MLRYVRQFHREIRPRIFHPVAYFAILCPIFLAEKVYERYNELARVVRVHVCMRARIQAAPYRGQRNNRVVKNVRAARWIETTAYSNKSNITNNII